MNELAQFSRLKFLLVTCAARKFLGGSRLRVTVVVTAGTVFWLLMFAMFLNVFIFLHRFEAIADILMDYMFAFFFLALLAMMTISNAIICYSSFYRSEEASFLLAMPVRAESVFIYKGAESALFSIWGMVSLVVPLILAFGITQGAPWYFYVFSLLMALIFLGLPMEVGALVALLVPLVVPRRRTLVLFLGAAAGLVIVVMWGFSMLAQRPTTLLTEAGFKEIMDRIAFCQHWALPSYWVSEGVLAAAHGAPRRAAFLLLLLLSNVMFLGVVVSWMGKLLYLRSWAASHQGRRERMQTFAGRAVNWTANVALLWLPLRLRLLVMKDFKTFCRDPAQWSQCLLFFGLLALYIVNLPRFGFAELAPYWHSVVSLLNLGATCLTLSTLTSRFIFPQLSLEGRRIWIIGLVPMERSTVLWGKFLFATMGSVIISGGLIALSDLMLGLPGWIVAVHLLIVLCVCCGLNGLAVGLGAIYPDMRSDNPSQVVSSFGGTLNLVCSIMFILASIIAIAAPMHMHAIGQLTGRTFRVLIATCLGAEVLLAAVVCLVPMAIGIRAFRRMEF